MSRLGTQMRRRRHYGGSDHRAVLAMPPPWVVGKPQKDVGVPGTAPRAVEGSGGRSTNVAVGGR